MLTVLQRVLGLTPRELGRAFPLFVYLFLAMAGSVASKATRDALFLDRFQATDLPYVDIAVAALVGVIAGVYIRVGARTNLRNIQIASLLVFASIAFGFWAASGPSMPGAASPASAGALFVAIYIWVGALSVLLPAQVWTLANYVLTTREAKRAFGFIGSGAILGWIVGGVATTAIVDMVGTEATLLWVGATLIAASVLVWAVWRKRPAPGCG